MRSSLPPACRGPVRLWAAYALFETYRGLDCGGDAGSYAEQVGGCGSFSFLSEESLSTLPGAYGLVQMCSLVLTLLRPRFAPLFALALLLRIGSFAFLVPFIWDSDYWGMQTDLSALIFALGWAFDLLELEWVRTTVRVQMGIFYAAAGLWKLNSAFLDVRYSCAPIFVAQLLDALPLGVGVARDVPASTVRALLALSPAMTIVGETAIGLLLLASAARGRHGVRLALMLHAGIGLTPPPNNIAEYGVMACARFGWLVPRGMSAALDEAVLGRRALGYAAIAAFAVLFLAACRQAHDDGRPPPEGAPSVDQPAACFAVCACLLLRALALETAADAPDDAPDDPPDDEAGRQRGTTHRVTYSLPSSTSPSIPSEAGASTGTSSTGMRRGTRRGMAATIALGALGALYAFGTVMLGTLDVSSPNMFSNLRMQGGSNHLLLPTGLLQALLRDAPPAASRFAGGVVRVEHCTSATINGVHPGELTPMLRPRARRYLRAAGHTGRQWNSAVAQIVGPDVMPPNPAAATRAALGRRGARRAPSLAYTLPASELRRLLAAARAAGERFALEYTQLPGTRGDEAWRRGARGRTIRLSEDGLGGRTCVVVEEGAPDGDASWRAPSWRAPSWLGRVLGGRHRRCDPHTELALVPLPPLLSGVNALAVGLSSNNYPVLRDKGPQDQLHCYGS